MPNRSAPRKNCAARPLAKPARGSLRWGLALAAALSLVTVLGAGTASATDLREGKLAAGAAPVLQNGGGTLRIEQPRLDASGRPIFVVPEPGPLWQLGSALGMLALLQARRRRVASRRAAAARS